jgi:peptide-methionine (R)-S-oxide reductase
MIMARFDLTPLDSVQREAIIVRLTGEKRDVLLEHGTEAAFCGVFLDNHKDGVYTCRFCGLPHLPVECEIRLRHGMAQLLRAL